MALTKLREITLSLKDLAGWFVWFPLRRIVQFLPLKVVLLLGNIGATLYFFLGIKTRKQVIEELSLLFGNRYSKKQIWRIARRSFRINTLRQIELLLFGKLTKEATEHIVSIKGLENVDWALNKGKGAIILLSHFGSFLLPLPALGFKGYKISQIGGEPLLKRNKVLSKKIFELRVKETSKLPINFLRTDQSMRTVFRSLKNNELVAIAFDGRIGKRWIPVKFFERVAHFSPGPVKLALKSEAPLLPTFIIRDKNNSHILIIEPPFELTILNSEEDTLAFNTKQLAKIFEIYISRYPCHFGMILRAIRVEAEEGLNYPLFPYPTERPGVI